MASPSNYSRLLSSNHIKWSNPQPVITGTVDFPEIGLGGNGVVAVDKEDQVLLDKVYSICNDPEVYTGIKLKQGQAMLINNRKRLHARTEFEPTGDTDKR
jgi:L-asparagine oxygenase